MNTISKRLGLALVCVVAITVVSIITIFRNTGNNVTSTLGARFSPVSRIAMGKFVKRIPQDKIAKILETDPFVIVDAYPIKLSEDPKMKDFDLSIVYRNGQGTFIGEEKGRSLQQVRTFSGNYYRFMYWANADVTKIPAGYQTIITSNKVGDQGSFQFKVEPSQTTATYSYDSCRVPPGCTASNSTLMTAVPPDATPPSDSCRVPPGCVYPMLNASIVNNLAEKNIKGYKTKK